MKQATRTVLVTLVVSMFAGLAAVAMGQTANPAGQAQVVVTVQAKNAGSALFQRNDIAVKLNRRPVDILNWSPLKEPNAGMQLVFLFDESARSDLSLQIPILRKFIQALPPSAAVGIAYMNNGRAVMAGPMTTDHTVAAKYLRVTNQIPGITGSPYFCLSNLAKHWPSKEQTSRRVVFMVTNGQDPYYESLDMQDPYVAAAIRDSQKAGLLVYSLYFQNRGFGDQSNLRITIGQSYLLRVADATGGEFYSLALVSPVSFDPFLKQFRQALDHQYLLTLPIGKSGWQQISVKSKIPNVKLRAPTAIYVDGKG